MLLGDTEEQEREKSKIKEAEREANSKVSCIDRVKQKFVDTFVADPKTNTGMITARNAVTVLEPTAPPKEEEDPLFASRTEGLLEEDPLFARNNQPQPPPAMAFASGTDVETPAPSTTTTTTTTTIEHQQQPPPAIQGFGEGVTEAVPGVYPSIPATEIPVWTPPPKSVAQPEDTHGYSMRESTESEKGILILTGKSRTLSISSLVLVLMASVVLCLSIHSLVIRVRFL